MQDGPSAAAGAGCAGTGSRSASVASACRRSGSVLDGSLGVSRIRPSAHALPHLCQLSAVQGPFRAAHIQVGRSTSDWAAAAAPGAAAAPVSRRGSSGLRGALARFRGHYCPPESRSAPHRTSRPPERAMCDGSAACALLQHGRRLPPPQQELQCSVDVLEGRQGLHTRRSSGARGGSLGGEPAGLQASQAAQWTAHECAGEQNSPCTTLTALWWRPWVRPGH